ncbi:MAG: MFS transporter [Alphaproteobacteria bacterium]|nr:MFS transporter [Alphaproteobacteria bacterium]
MASLTPEPTLPPRRRLAAILGGAAGNLVEWYDWFAYASFSIYFSKVFFPPGAEIDQRLQAAGIFAIGFIARPLGAWITGVFADRHGRKLALVVSVALMCAGSLAVAVLPGYAVIGPAAPLILTLARLVQGLSIGGEYGVSATYMSEMAGRRRRGFWSSFQFVTLIGGQIIALGVLIVLQHTLSPADLQAFGWRIAFVIGAALALVVWRLQTDLEESAAFVHIKAQGPTAGTPRSGLVTLIARFPRETGIIFVLTSAGSLSFYAYTTYMQKYLTDTAHFSKATAADLSAVALILFLAVQPFFGWVGDLVGRRRILALAFGAGALAAWPIFTGIARASSPALALALICAALFLLAGYTAVNAVVKSELFPAEVRTLGVALPYALGNAVFGGTAELVAEAFRKWGFEGGFFIYLAAIQAAGFLTALMMRDTQARSLIVED